MKRILHFTDFNNQDLHEDFEAELEIVDSEEDSDNQELSGFEEACIEEGIEFSYEEDLYEAAAPAAASKGEKKSSGKITPENIAKAKEAMASYAKKSMDVFKQSLGIKTEGPIKGVSETISKGFQGVLDAVKSGKTKSLSKAALENADLKKVSDVIKSTLEKALEGYKKDPMHFYKIGGIKSIQNLGVIASTIESQKEGIEKSGLGSFVGGLKKVAKAAGAADTKPVAGKVTPTPTAKA